jgi:hypothetical protein
VHLHPDQEVCYTMRWYSNIKSILFRDRRNTQSRTAPRHRYEVRKLPIPPQPALARGTLDRRAIRLRRD